MLESALRGQKFEFLNFFPNKYSGICPPGATIRLFRRFANRYSGIYPPGATFRLFRLFANRYSGFSMVFIHFHWKYADFACFAWVLYSYLMLFSIFKGDRAPARAWASPRLNLRFWVGAYPFILQPTLGKSENPLSKACGKKQNEITRFATIFNDSGLGTQPDPTAHSRAST